MLDHCCYICVFVSNLIAHINGFISFAVLDLCADWDQGEVLSLHWNRGATSALVLFVFSAECWWPSPLSACSYMRAALPVSRALPLPPSRRESRAVLMRELAPPPLQMISSRVEASWRRKEAFQKCLDVESLLQLQTAEDWVA